MIYFILLIVGKMLVVTSGFSLNCTNDMETLISCYIEAENCTRLSQRMDRLNNVADTSMTGTCEFEPCARGCCCTTKLKFLSLGDNFSAKVYKDGQRVHSQTINLDHTYKPPAPSISVEQMNGKIQWCLNETKYIPELKAIVTFQKIGSNNKPPEPWKVNSTKVNEKCYETDDFSLEPNTAYVVSVKIYANFGVVSDSSEKYFTTAPPKQSNKPPKEGLITIILCLSVAAIIFSATAFAFSVSLKGKLWDKVKEERPKLLDIKPNKKVILTPETLSVYSLSVEPLVPKNSLTLSKESLYDSSSGQTSGISTASSSDDFDDCVLQALKGAFPNFTPAKNTFSFDESPQGCVGPPPLEKTPSPVSFDNNSYISTNQTDRTHDMDLQMTCDAGYDSSDGPTLQDFVAPTHVSVAMAMDMSYQPCALSGEASGGSQKLSVSYGYQGFEDLVEQSNHMSSTEEAEECLSLIQGVSDDVPSASNEIIVDHGYHCV